jgi:hypothetical protein
MLIKLKKLLSPPFAFAPSSKSDIMLLTNYQAGFFWNPLKRFLFAFAFHPTTFFLWSKDLNESRAKKQFRRFP